MTWGRHTRQAPRVSPAGKISPLPHAQNCLRQDQQPSFYPLDPVLCAERIEHDDLSGRFVGGLCPIVHSKTSARRCFRPTRAYQVRFRDAPRQHYCCMKLIAPRVGVDGNNRATKGRRDLGVRPVCTLGPSASESCWVWAVKIVSGHKHRYVTLENLKAACDKLCYLLTFFS